jgi:hypothetical protein
MQIELCFNLPGAGDSCVSAPEWRQKLALAGDGVLPSWFFGRDVDGAASSPFPQIRFLGGRRALRIVAFGDETSESLSALMPVLFKLVNRAAGTTVPVRMNQHTAAARPTYQRLYHVAAPMLTRRGDRRGRYANDADVQTRNSHVKKRVAHGLARQAAFFGLDFPSDDEIDLVQCGDYRAKRIHEGFAYGVQYAVVGMPVNLQGIWQTGLVLSHGHGAVTPYRRQTAESEAA